MNLPNYSIGRHRQLGSPANLMGILSLNIVQDERKTMRTLSYRMDFKHWLPTLYPRARIDLTNWLLTSFGGKDLQEPQARLWRAHFTIPQAFTYFMSQPEDIQSNKNMQAAFCEREPGPNYR
jgi:hypothetical protein